MKVVSKLSYYYLLIIALKASGNMTHDFLLIFLIIIGGLPYGKKNMTHFHLLGESRFKFHPSYNTIELLLYFYLKKKKNTL